MSQDMRMALKGMTPSARARLKYILRDGMYAVGRDGRRDDLRGSGSGNLPSWAGDAADFWQGVDQFERANARLCVELELSLPHELTLEQQQWIVEQYAERLLGGERLPYTWAIHHEGKNAHVHLMFQERGLDGIDRPDAQAWFKRANSKEPDRGGAKKSRSITGAAWTMHARATWAAAVNDGLRAAGLEARFDHRSKAAQRDEALRSGDLRRAAALSTITERHEGAAVHGMRRRAERGEMELDDLPDYARTLILQNDSAREYNCWLRDWARSAPDEALREFLAEDLADLCVQLEQENPCGHVTAWLGEQHQAASIEDAERAAIEQRQRLGELREALREAVRDMGAAEALAAELRQRLDEAQPPELALARDERVHAERAARAAQSWRAEHPMAARLSDLFGVVPAQQRAAVEALARYEQSPVLATARAWLDEQRRIRLELEALEQQLPGLRQRPRQIEDEILPLLDAGRLCTAIQAFLATAQESEPGMSPAARLRIQQRRLELTDKMHRSGGSDELALLYRDAEGCAEQAGREVAAWAQERGLACLREAIGVLQRALDEQPPVEQRKQLSEALAHVRRELNAPERRRVDDCEALLARAIELTQPVEDVTQSPDARAALLAGLAAVEHYEPEAAEPKPRPTGPRMG